MRSTKGECSFEIQTSQREILQNVTMTAEFPLTGRPPTGSRQSKLGEKTEDYSGINIRSVARKHAFAPVTECRRQFDMMLNICSFEFLQVVAGVEVGV